MEKPIIFINGNIKCHESFRASTLWPFNKVLTHANPDDLDLTDAIIINGDLWCDSMDIKSHMIACAGTVTAYGIQSKVDKNR